MVKSINDYIVPKYTIGLWLLLVLIINVEFVIHQGGQIH